MRTFMDFVDFMEYCEQNYRDKPPVFIYDIYQPSYSMYDHANVVSTYTNILTSMVGVNAVHFLNDYGLITFNGVKRVILDELPKDEWDDKCIVEDLDSLASPDKWRYLVDLNRYGDYFCPTRLTFICGNGRTSENDKAYEVLVSVDSWQAPKR